MRNKSLYLWFLLPITFSFLAYLGFGFIYKAAVSSSCLIIIFNAFSFRLQKFQDTWFIILAFVFSIIGDWFLSNKEDSFLMFAVGIAMYFLAHLGYLVFALYNGSLNRNFTGILLVIYLVFFFIVLWPAINEPILLIAVLIYLLISCISPGAAINLKGKSIVRWSYFAGIALILFSDTIISFKEFTSYQKMNFLILPTYYAAHIIITYAVVKKVEN